MLTIKIIAGFLFGAAFYTAIVWWIFTDLEIGKIPPKKRDKD